MLGMNADGGGPLDGVAHVKQSIRDILTTRIGTRVMRRDYGSELPALVDRPINGHLTMELYAATAAALDAWEPRAAGSNQRGFCSVRAGGAGPAGNLLASRT